MSRILTFCAAMLMLALVATVPVLAEAPAQVDQTQGEAVLLDLDQAEEPLMTSAEQSWEADLQWQSTSRCTTEGYVCENDSTLCPPGCTCAFWRCQLYCIC